jgi:hypothetical protein
MTLAQRMHLDVVGRPFHAVVPRPVVALAIGVVLADDLVVLVVVRDDVVEAATFA